MIHHCETGDYDDGLPWIDNRTIGDDNRRHYSPSAIASIVGGISGRDWIIIAVFAIITAFYIHDRGKLQNELSQASAVNTEITKELRSNTVATDLAKYNAQEVRIQTEVNKQLMTALACKR